MRKVSKRQSNNLHPFIKLHKEQHGMATSWKSASLDLQLYCAHGPAPALEQFA